MGESNSASAGNRNYSLPVVVRELPCFTVPSGTQRVRGMADIWQRYCPRTSLQKSRLSSRFLTIVIAQSNLDVVEPSSIPLQPVHRHGLEGRGPELEMGGAVGFSFDRR